MRRQVDYPIGSISSGTMRPEDLIPTFVSELEYRLKHGPRVSREARKAHGKLVREINARVESVDSLGDCDDCDNYYASEDSESDLESLFDALGEYAAPYWYFGSHPGDGADYGYFLSEEWDADFVPMNARATFGFSGAHYTKDNMPDAIKVSDLAEVPAWFRGEVAVVSDHGNVTLYTKTSRGLREIWSVV